MTKLTYQVTCDACGWQAYRVADASRTAYGQKCPQCGENRLRHDLHQPIAHAKDS